MTNEIELVMDYVISNQDYFIPANYAWINSYRLKHILESQLNTYISQKSTEEAFKKLCFKVVNNKVYVRRIPVRKINNSLF